MRAGHAGGARREGHDMNNVDEHRCECGNPISETTVHVPCVDCGRHVMVADDECQDRWRCGTCGGTPVAARAGKDTT